MKILHAKLFPFRILQEKLEEPVSSPPSPLDISNGDTSKNLTQHIGRLRNEVSKLRNMLLTSQNECKLTLCVYFF